MFESLLAHNDAVVSRQQTCDDDHAEESQAVQEDYLANKKLADDVVTRNPDRSNLVLGGVGLSLYLYQVVGDSADVTATLEKWLYDEATGTVVQLTKTRRWDHLQRIGRQGMSLLAAEAIPKRFELKRSRARRFAATTDLIRVEPSLRIALYNGRSQPDSATVEVMQEVSNDPGLSAELLVDTGYSFVDRITVHGNTLEPLDSSELAQEALRCARGDLAIDQIKAEMRHDAGLGADESMGRVKNFWTTDRVRELFRKEDQRRDDMVPDEGQVADRHSRLLHSGLRRNLEIVTSLQKIMPVILDGSVIRLERNPSEPYANGPEPLPKITGPIYSH